MLWKVFPQWATHPFSPTHILMRFLGVCSLED
jgi:hypothetical protein